MNHMKISKNEQNKQVLVSQKFVKIPRKTGEHWPILKVSPDLTGNPRTDQSSSKFEKKMLIRQQNLLKCLRFQRISAA